ncbi:MAG: ABC transporter permease subunit [Rothia sp. (in: high G+C Gram-positive bacteria)]|nr:ABC transporter permease subunit [Rothia sp. (in: high G+C Gram-positive bacteria)]
MRTKNRQFRSVPAFFILPAALGLLLILGPLLGLASNIPWTEVGSIMASDQGLAAVRLSISTALISTLLCALLGLPLSLLLAKVLARSRYQKIGRILYALIYTPVILSPVVSGLALIFFWGKKGLLGAWLYQQFAISLPFTPAAVVLTQIFVGLPFFVAASVTTLGSIPKEYEEIALVEGASAWEISLKVLLPIAAPGIATGTLLSFARALGEYGATLTFAGNIAEKTRTIPLNIELMLSSNYMPQALGAAFQLISLYLIVLALALLLWNLNRLRKRT